MLGFIIYIIAALCFIAAIVLLTFIPNKAVRIVSPILLMVLFIGVMAIVMFKVSGQQNFLNVFDAFNSGANSSQTYSNNSSDSLTDTSNQESGYDVNEAKITLNEFLDAWQKQDIGELSMLAAAGAGIKLDSELPLENQPQIKGYEIISIDDFDAASGILPAKVKVTVLDNSGISKEIIFTFNLSNYSGKWYITGGIREDGSPNLFNLNDSQSGEAIPANTPAASASATSTPAPTTATSTPVPTIAPVSDEDAVQQAASDYLSAFFNEDYDKAYSLLVGRAKEGFVPELYFKKEITSLDWELLSYNVSEIEVEYGLQLVAVANVRLYADFADGTFSIIDISHHLVKTASGWFIEYIDAI